MRKHLLAGAGGVGAAFVGSLCCTGPLIFVTLGVGAGWASSFEPLRPVFGALMLAFFAVAFYAAYGKAGRQRQSDAACQAKPALPRSAKREKLILWIAALVAVVLWTFPTWSRWVV